MYKNILVPVSFDTDRDAETAVTISRSILKEGGKIRLMHVVEHQPQYSSDLLPEDHFEHAKASVKEKFGTLIEGVTEASIDVVEGHAGRTILDYAASHDIDCIIIASHKPGLQDYFLGSTAARVVRHAKCSVHVVR